MSSIRGERKPAGPEFPTPAEPETENAQKVGEKFTGPSLEAFVGGRGRSYEHATWRATDPTPDRKLSLFVTQ